MAKEVKLYGKENCVQCTALERKLTERKIDFDHEDATTAENLQFIKSLDPGYSRAPIVTVSENGVIVDHWTGYRPDKIDELATA